MIDRYTGTLMGKLWSEEIKFRFWLLVEIAVLKARQKLGEIKGEIHDNFDIEIVIDPAEINRIEKEITKHDVVAFLTHVNPQFPEHLRSLLHRGMTSYDVVDTALMLTMKQSLEFILDKLDQLMIVLKEKAFEHKYTAMIGPTLAARITWPVASVCNSFKDFPEDAWSNLRMPSHVPMATFAKDTNAVEFALNVLAQKNPAIYMQRQKAIERLDA